MDADSADAAEVEEREDEVVVAGVEVEAEAGDAARLLEVVVRLLDGGDVVDRASCSIVSGSMLMTTRLGML